MPLVPIGQDGTEPPGPVKFGRLRPEPEPRVAGKAREHGEALQFDRIEDRCISTRK